MEAVLELRFVSNSVLYIYIYYTLYGCLQTAALYMNVRLLLKHQTCLSLLYPFTKRLGLKAKDVDLLDAILGHPAMALSETWVLVCRQVAEHSWHTVSWMRLVLVGRDAQNFGQLSPSESSVVPSKERGYR